MTKYVLLKSFVPSTCDFGFRSLGYEVVDFIDNDVEIEQIKKGVLSDMIDGLVRQTAVMHAIERKKKHAKDLI